MSPSRWMVVLLVVMLPLAACAPADAPERATAAQALAAQENEFASRFKPVMGVQIDGFRMQTERHENQNLMTYHVSARVTSRLIENLRMPDVAPANLALLRDLSEAAGVKEVTLYPYEIVIKKAHVFEWDEITPTVASIVHVHLQPKAAVPE